MFEDLLYMLPELVLFCGALAVLLIGMVANEKFIRGTSVILTAIATVIAVVEFATGGGKEELFGGFIVHTDHVYFARILVSTSGFATFLMFFFSRRNYRYEFSVIMLIATFGALTLVEAGNFLSFYLSFELIGFSSYVLVCFNRSSSASSEAAVKFFILGALSSCVMLYGISFVYGYSSGLSFNVLADVLRGKGSLGITLGCALIFSGVLFKLAAVPFHMWVPDTYQGAPMVAVSFFTIVTKTAVVLLLTSITREVDVAGEGFRLTILVLASLSMIIGEFGALQQKNIKRLLAYANVGHLGYVLAGLGGTSATFKALLYYVIVYLLINTWVFSVLLKYDDEGFEIPKIAGMSSKNPISAASFVAAMLSTAGLPPFSGFFAKYTILRAIVGADVMSIYMFMCVLCLCLTSIVPCFYCFRIAKVVYFDKVSGDYPVLFKSWGLSGIAFVCILLSVVMILWWVWGWF